MKSLKLGTAIYRGVDTPLNLEVEALHRHLYIVGRTGSGKTSLLLSVLSQLLKEGEGLCLIDPHGDLAESLLDYVPKLVVRESGVHQRSGGGRDQS